MRFIRWCHDRSLELFLSAIVLVVVLTLWGL